MAVPAPTPLPVHNLISPVHLFSSPHLFTTSSQPLLFPSQPPLTSSNPPLFPSPVHNLFPSPHQFTTSSFPSPVHNLISPVHNLYPSPHQFTTSSFPSPVHNLISPVHLFPSLHQFTTSSFPSPVHNLLSFPSPVHNLPTSPHLFCCLELPYGLLLLLLLVLDWLVLLSNCSHPTLCIFPRILRMLEFVACIVIFLRGEVHHTNTYQYCSAIHMYKCTCMRIHVCTVCVVSVQFSMMVTQSQHQIVYRASQISPLDKWPAKSEFLF